MNDQPIAIKVENLSKSYRIYNKPNDRLRQLIYGSHKQFYEEFWAVKSISFEIRKGDIVGIVGRNGSGKSTLLQMICGTLNPTAGFLKVDGRVSALLELGSGFNPEFTGKENIYLNSSVLGLTKNEIDQRYDQILDFAEIGDFVERQVKTYSTGMLMRLAFSVAINVNPDILVIDEALSVGDELFQRKCFARIEQLNKSGTTVLFVSHSTSVIAEICDKAILLFGGSKIAEGLPREVLAEYQKLLYSKEPLQQDKRKALLSSFSEPDLNKYDTENNDDFYIPDFKSTSVIEIDSMGAIIDKQSLSIKTIDGREVNHLVHGKKYIYSYKVFFDKTLFNIRFGMVIKTISGLSLGGTLSSSARGAIKRVEKGSLLTISFTFENILNAGVYYLNAGVFSIVGGNENLVHRVVDGIAFKVIKEVDQISTELVDFKIDSKVSFNG